MFLEIIFKSSDFAFDGRDAIEDPLDEALQAAQLGEVTGGGSGGDSSNIDIEVNDLERGLPFVQKILRELNVAPSTVIIQYTPQKIVHKVYE